MICVRLTTYITVQMIYMQEVAPVAELYAGRLGDARAEFASHRLVQRLVLLMVVFHVHLRRTYA